MGELTPVWLINASLDGDDDPHLSAENVERLLHLALQAMLSAGAVRGFAVERLQGSFTSPFKPPFPPANPSNRRDGE